MSKIITKPLLIQDLTLDQGELLRLLVKMEEYSVNGDNETTIPNQKDVVNTVQDIHNKIAFIHGRLNLLKSQITFDTVRALSRTVRQGTIVRDKYGSYVVDKTTKEQAFLECKHKTVSNGYTWLNFAERFEVVEF